MDVEATGNKGEWSEPYVLLRLLADGKLAQGLPDLSESDEAPYRVIAANRREKIDGKAISKLYNVEGDNVSIVVDGVNCGTVSIDDFAEHAGRLFNEILQSSGASFSVSEQVSRFLSSIQCNKITADSADKTDINVVIHDHFTGANPNLGFSVKSQLGQASTLINASKDNTNFRYQLKGEIDSSLAKEINSISPRTGKIQARIEELARRGVTLNFDRVVGDVYFNNLLLLDSDLAEILSNCLSHYYSGQGARLGDIVEDLSTSNPLDYPEVGSYPYYELKLKKFLTESALGMMPKTPWTGIYNATGGYVVVKSDGRLVSYHLLKKNLFEGYLLSNVKFDTPSSSRHKFGEVYFDETGQAMFNLNLQVRFLQ